jgi:hypothetical protein
MATRLALPFLIGLALVACQSGRPEIEGQPPSAPAAQTAFEAEAPAEPVSGPDATAPGQAASPASATPAVESEPSQAPTVRPALAASDPTRVTLGAGRPALVEFFAFW